MTSSEASCCQNMHQQICDSREGGDGGGRCEAEITDHGAVRGSMDRELQGAWPRACRHWTPVSNRQAACTATRKLPFNCHANHRRRNTRLLCGV